MSQVVESIRVPVLFTMVAMMLASIFSQASVVCCPEAFLPSLPGVVRGFCELLGLLSDSRSSLSVDTPNIRCRTINLAAPVRFPFRAFNGVNLMVN